jgi:transcriptional regulator with XRE-family HTH domain
MVGKEIPMSSIVSGRQLRAARVLAGLTQAQLAAATGFHERACRYWESRGENPPTSVPSTLEKIGAALEAQGVVVFREPTPGVRIAEKR